MYLPDSVTDVPLYAYNAIVYISTVSIRTQNAGKQEGKERSGGGKRKAITMETKQK